MAHVQRQDSLTEQLRDLIPVANFHGMYDAADFLVTATTRSRAQASCRTCGGLLVEQDRRMEPLIPRPTGGSC